MKNTLTKLVAILLLFFAFSGGFVVKADETKYIKEYKEILVGTETKYLITLTNGENLLADEVFPEKNVLTFKVGDEETTMSFSPVDTSVITSLIEQSDKANNRQMLLVYATIIASLSFFASIYQLTFGRYDFKGRTIVEILMIWSAISTSVFFFMNIFSIGAAKENNYKNLVVLEGVKIHVEQTGGEIPLIEEAILGSGELNVLYLIDKEKLVEVDHRLADYVTEDFAIEKESGDVYVKSQKTGKFKKVQP